MSADEIKALAQQAFVDGVANHKAGFRNMESRCKQYATAILDFAAMVERCEKALKCNFVAQDGRTTINSAVKAQVNYILKGIAK